MEWRCSNGLFDLGFPGFWLNCINWLCYCIDRQRLEMEEKVILRKLVRVITPFSFELLFLKRESYPNWRRRSL